VGDAVIRVIIARHGVTEWNQDGRYQGHRDVPLGEAGRQQAERLGRRLAGEHVTAAYTSDLGRARQTAEIALAGRESLLMTAPELRETCFGAWEGLQAREIADRYPAEWDAWIRDPVHARPPGGETVEDVHRRVVFFYRSIVDAGNGKHQPRDWFSYRASGPLRAEGEDQTILVVTHGGPVRALLTYLLEVRLDLYWRFGIRPASVSILDVYPEGAITEVIGDTSHLT
jgi:alpha-ribazole phosphatase